MLTIEFLIDCTRWILISSLWNQCSIDFFVFQQFEENECGTAEFSCEMDRSIKSKSDGTLWRSNIEKWSAWNQSKFNSKSENIAKLFNEQNSNWRKEFVKNKSFEILCEKTNDEKENLEKTLTLVSFNDFHLTQDFYNEIIDFLMKNSLIKQIGNDEVQMNDGSFVALMQFFWRFLCHFDRYRIDTI